MLVAPQYSKVQKRDVTTYRVNPRDKGSLHCSIQQAVDKADPYSRIVLAAGQYFESITIQQPLEIVGEDGTGTPEVCARGVCLSVLGDVETYFENIKFLTKLGQFSKAASRNAETAVRVTGGRPTFTKCFMTSLFIGGDAIPSVSLCRIEGNVCGTGLIVGEGAGGEYFENTICNHIPFAVQVRSRGAPTFRDNYIYQDPKVIVGYYSGPYADRNGGAVMISLDSADPSQDITKSISPKFLRNRIGDEVSPLSTSITAFDALTDADVALYGDFEQFLAERRTVVVESGCTPTFEENTITGGHIGISLSTGSSGTFVNNNVSHAQIVGVLGGVNATTTFRFNVVSRCATGILAQSTSMTITQNSVKENVGCGLLLLLAHDDNFRMEGNSFVGNDVGIAIRPSSGTRIKLQKDTGTPGKALLERTYICLNKSAGVISLGCGYDAVLQELEVGANGRCGVLCAYNSTATLLRVKFDRGAVGLISEKNANPLVEDCTFTAQGDAAIMVRDRGRGSILRNNITAFAQVGVYLDDGADPVVSHNKIMSNSGTGVHVCHGAAGVIERNEIDMVARGVSITAYGDPLVQENKITSCTEAGVVVFDEGCGTITENLIAACAVGVACSRGGECVVRGNTIKSCLRFGILAGEGSRAMVEKNDVDSNAAGNILLEGAESNSVVRRNQVTLSSGFGIRAQRDAQGLVTDNTMSGNRDGGIGSESGAQTRFTFNRCVRERGAGIKVLCGGAGMFEKNTVSESEGAGIELLEKSCATVNLCEVTTSSCGLRLHSNAGGAVKSTRLAQNQGPGVEFFGFGCHAQTILDQLDIASNTEEGVRALDHSAGRILRTRIAGHSVGAFLQCAGELVLENCRFEDNAVGVRFDKKGTATVQHSTFCKQSEADVEFSSTGRGLVSQCTMGMGSTLAVFGSYNGGGVVSDSTIRGCTATGCRFLKGSFTTVQKTTVEQCVVGFLCEELSSPFISECTVRHCSDCNVKLLPTSSPLLRGNTIERSATSGVVVMSRSGRLEGNTISNNELHGLHFICVDFSDDVTTAVSGGPILRRRSMARRQSKASSGGGEEESIESHDAPKFTNLVCAGNVVRNNAASGVFFDRGTHAELLSNEIHLNSDAGIVCCAGSTPEIGKGNRVHHNAVCGIVLRSSSSPAVRETKISFNDPCNVCLEERSGGSFEECDISDALVDGVTATQSLVQMRHCRFHGCAQGSAVNLLGPNKHFVLQECEFASNAVGVCADIADCSARVQQCTFRANTVAGVRVENGGSPEVRDNIFERGVVGVLLKDGALGILQGNKFVRNNEGLSITGVAIGTVCNDNTFEDNDKGVVLRQTDGFVLEGCSFGSSEHAAVSCEEASRCTIRGNRFTRGYRGVMVVSTATPWLVNNQFVQLRCGVEVSARGLPKVEKNYFLECEIGCRLSSNAVGIVVSTNAFQACVTAGVVTEKGSGPSVTRNLFSDCSASATSAGVVVGDGGGGVFHENDFHRNSVSILGTHGSTGEFTRCMIHDSRVGASFEQGSQTTMDRCTFFGNILGDLISKTGAAPVVKNSFFTKSQSPAIQLLTGAAGTYQYCNFKECVTSFLIEDCSSATVANNVISNGAVGISFRKGVSRASVTRNLLQNCDLGLQCATGGGALVSQNFILGGEVGALIEKRSAVKLFHNMFHKTTKQGILLKGNGTVTIANNIVQDCAPVGLQVSVPVERGGGSVADADVTSTIVLENLFVGSRINVQLSSGDVVLRKNHVQKGDYGLVVLPESRATLDSNVMYDCTRATVTLGSRHCSFANNLFYSLNESGAFETSHDANPILSKDNGVYNSCNCKLAQPLSSAPLKVVDMDLFRAKDVLGSLQQSLLSLHTVELPAQAACGCPAIPGSFDRKVDEDDDGKGSAAKKVSNAARRVSSVANMLNRGKRKGSEVSGSASLTRQDSTISLSESIAMSGSFAPSVPKGSTTLASGGGGFRRSSLAATAAAVRRPSTDGGKKAA